MLNNFHILFQFISFLMKHNFHACFYIKFYSYRVVEVHFCVFYQWLVIYVIWQIFYLVCIFIVWIVLLRRINFNFYLLIILFSCYHLYDLYNKLVLKSMSLRISPSSFEKSYNLLWDKSFPGKTQDFYSPKIRIPQQTKVQIPPKYELGEP